MINNNRLCIDGGNDGILTLQINDDKQRNDWYSRLNSANINVNSGNRTNIDIADRFDVKIIKANDAPPKFLLELYKNMNRHENVINIYHYFEHENLLFIIFEQLSLLSSLDSLAKNKITKIR